MWERWLAYGFRGFFSEVSQFLSIWFDLWVLGALSRVSQFARPVGRRLTFEGGHSASS